MTSSDFEELDPVTAKTYEDDLKRDLDLKESDLDLKESRLDHKKKFGYWRCPKCGADDAFLGTETATRKGPTVGMVTDMGVAVSNTQYQNVEQQVWKCRQCGERLSYAYNHVSGTEELQEAQASGEWAVACLIILLIILIPMLIYLIFFW